MIRRSTWIVLLVLIVLIGVVFYVQRKEPASDQGLLEGTETPLVLDIDAANVTGLRVVSADGKIFYATRSGAENWTLVQPNLSGGLNQATLESDLSQLLTIKPLSRLETGLGLEAMGLITPDYSIRVSLAGQQERLLEIGGDTPTGSGSYVRVDNTDLIVVPKYNLQPILELLDDIPFITPTPK